MSKNRGMTVVATDLDELTNAAYYAHSYASNIAINEVREQHGHWQQIVIRR